MAQFKEPTSGKTYVNIVNGELVIKVPEGTDGSRERENKNGKVVHEMVYKSVSGVITKIFIDETDFGDSLSVELDNEVTFNMPFESSYSRGFLLSSKNIDFTKEVKLAPYSFTPKGTDKVKKGLTVYDSEGEKVVQNWDDVPEPTTKMVKKKETFDYTDQINYLYDLANSISIDAPKAQPQEEEEAQDDLSFLDD